MTVARDRDGLRAQAEAVAGNVPGALLLAGRLGRTTPVPGTGQTRRRLATLATVASVDLTVARTVEPHLDALAILAEADGDPAGSARSERTDLDCTWGVFAAESPDAGVSAKPDSRDDWWLNGTKAWCSLAGSLDRALITTQADDGRRLFAVNLKEPTVRADHGGWIAHGLPTVVSGPVTFADTIARPIGGPDWYLTRAGFSWGGIGVAACWYGAARTLAENLRSALVDRPPREIELLQLGRVDQALHAAAVSLAAAADDIDGHRADGPAGPLLAARVRGIVAGAAELTLEQVGHALGPARLAFDGSYAQRVADLRLYLAQHHGELDGAALGRAALSQPADLGL